MAPAPAKTVSSSPDLAIGRSPDGRRGGKSAEAFWTISEVARELDLPQHVLRFWETKFPHVRPLKRGGGRRYYRPEEVALLRRIRDLLYKDRYTIKGVQKLLRQSDATAVAGQGEGAGMVEKENGGLKGSQRAELQAMLEELETIRALLNDSPG